MSSHEPNDLGQQEVVGVWIHIGSLLQRHKSSFWRHFKTGSLLGLIVAFLFAVAHELPQIKALEREGDDATARLFLGSNPSAPPDIPPVFLVVIDSAMLDRWRSLYGGSEVMGLAELVETLRAHRPATIIIDQDIRETVDKNAASKLLDALGKAGSQEDSTRIVVMPRLALVDARGHQAVVAEDGPLNALRHNPNVRFAAPILLPDADGVVRSAPRSVCLRWPDGTFETVPDLGTNKHSVPRPGCHLDSDLRILFRVGRDTPLNNDAALRRLSARDNFDGLRPGSIVLVGELEGTAWGDQHMTPVGLMPGLLVHANALLTTLDPDYRERETISKIAQHALELLTIFVAAAAFSTLIVAAEYNFGFRLLLLPGFIATTFLLVLFIGAMHLLVAYGFLRYGIRVGSLTPAFATGLEALVKAGDTIISPLERTVERASRWRKGWLIAIVVLALYLLLPVVGLAAAVAEDIPAGTLSVQCGIGSSQCGPDQAAVWRRDKLLQGEHRNGMLVFDLLSSDLVKLGAGAKGYLKQENAPEQLHEGPDSFFVAPPPEAPTGPTVVGALVEFWRLLYPPPAQEPRRGGTDRMRGSNPAVEGPLRWLPQVPAGGQLLPVGAPGVPMAWAGGVPPFRVTLEGARSGKILIARSVDTRILQDTGVAMPDEPVAVTVLDSAGNSMSDRIQPSPSPPPVIVPAAEARAAPADAAMALFALGGPSWRLEALRQLALLAPTNPHAALALDKVLAARWPAS